MLARGAVPVVRLLLVLGAVVGLPFFVVGTTSPLLQQWFSRTGHEHQDDPVLPLRREQPWQHGGARRVSGDHRTVARAGRSGAALEVGVRGSRRPRRGVRGDHLRTGPVARRRARARSRRRRRARHVAPSRAVGPRGLRPVVVPPRRHHVHHDRRRRDPALLGPPASDLPRQLHPRLRPAPPPLAALRRARAAVRAHGHRHARRRAGVDADPAHRGRPPRDPLLRVDGVPRRARAGPSADDAPDRVLFLGVGRRRGRGDCQRPRRAIRVRSHPVEYPLAMVLAAACRRVAGEARWPGKKDWAFVVGLGPHPGRRRCRQRAPPRPGR